VSRCGWRAGWVVVLWCGAVAMAGAAPVSPSGGARRSTTVTADHLEVRREQHRAVYIGNVVATTADLTVTADRMEFDFDERMEVVERMRAVGHVHIVRSDGGRAVADHATYYVPEERVVLEGGARAWQGDDTVSGARITLFLGEDRQVAEGDGKDRVVSVIHSKRQPERPR